MINVKIPKEIVKKIEEVHTKYILKEIPRRWEEVLKCQAIVDKQKVSSKELKLLYRALRRNNIVIPASKWRKKRYEMESKIVEICTTRNLKKYSLTKEKLFLNVSVNIRERLNNILLYIIGYKEFNIHKDVKTDNYNIIKWNRHQLVNELNIKVCPYCNRQYITSYYVDGIKRTTADTDHYYPKKMFPLLSMNIYNLVPSCQICNSRMKLDKVKKVNDMHLYPYNDKDDVLKFEIPFNNLDELYNFNKNSVHIEIKVNKNKKKVEIKKGEKSIEIFRLKQIYEAHSDVIYELKNNMRDYSEEQFERVFNKNYKGLFNNYQQLEEVVFSFVSKNLCDEPLVKLKQDIYKQILDEQGK